ncbi:hypothetical protein ES708_04013 [subsurface metagenome]
MHHGQLLGYQVELQVEYSLEAAELLSDQGDLLVTVHLGDVEDIAVAVFRFGAGGGVAEVLDFLTDRARIDTLRIVLYLHRGGGEIDRHPEHPVLARQHLLDRGGTVGAVQALKTQPVVGEAALQLDA